MGKPGLPPVSEHATPRAATCARHDSNMRPLPPQGFPWSRCSVSSRVGTCCFAGASYPRRRVAPHGSTKPNLDVWATIGPRGTRLTSRVLAEVIAVHASHHVRLGRSPRRCGRSSARQGVLRRQGSHADCPSSVSDRVHGAAWTSEQTNPVQVRRRPADPIVERPSKPAREPFGQFLLGSENRVASAARTSAMGRSPPAEYSSSRGRMSVWKSGTVICRSYSKTRMAFGSPRLDRAVQRGDRNGWAAMDVSRSASSAGARHGLGSGRGRVTRGWQRPEAFGSPDPART
jgi:hypothetical protein